MKAFLIFILALIIVGCAPANIASDAQATEPVAEDYHNPVELITYIPDWFLSPPTDDDILYGVAAAENISELGAFTLARIQAIGNLAEQFGLSSQVIKERIMRFDKSDGNSYSETSTIATRLEGRVDLSNIRVVKVVPFRMSEPSLHYQTYVMVAYTIPQDSLIVQPIFGEN